MTVAGTYSIVLNTPMGQQNGTLVVRPDASDGFSGEVTGGMIGTLPISGGKVDGGRLTWTMEMKAPMPMTLDCEATVDGDAISGTVKAGAFGKMDLSGTRTA